ECAPRDFAAGPCLIRGNGSTVDYARRRRKKASPSRPIDRSPAGPAPQPGEATKRTVLMGVSLPVSEVTEPRSEPPSGGGATGAVLQMPVWHWPEPHTVPSGALGFEHWPVAALQVPAWWQLSMGAHVTVEVGVPQTPAWQVSPAVQALP